MTPAAHPAGAEEPVMPDPLTEEPPPDQFCDLVLNGGVASGVVYPWALLEIARRYRFKNIGGNSVGAMAAALAAAAEYGRCNGVENAFEPLRRVPIELAKEKDGKAKMLRLFRPSPPVQRLFDAFLTSVSWAELHPARAKAGAIRRLAEVADIYMVWDALLVLLVGMAAVAVATASAWPPLALTIASLAGALALALAFGLWLLWRDLSALADNAYGLCKGMGRQTKDDEGLVQWLHEGIQRSAGREMHDPPLTFAELWATPRFGRVGPAPLADGTMPPGPGIDLQMFTSNITQGRPVRLPLRDSNTRLYYAPDEWKGYFPASVLAALERASLPYRPHSVSDPDPGDARDQKHQCLLRRLRELPSGGMPIVVAARLSLCFPLLFSLVPVYAIDYEAPVHKRRLRRCWLADGGLCTNFPVHLFDAAHPQWPTFALLLDQRLQQFNQQPTWLPIGHLEGRGDNWQRDVPGAELPGTPTRTLGSRLLGLVGGIVLTMKDWNDRVTGRLPQVRNRVIRLALRADKGEGQLNIAMSSETILRMAHEYGSAAGKTLVRRFAPGSRGTKRAWREHLYVRSMIELRALRRHLKGYAKAVRAAGSTVPLRELLDAATHRRPLTLRYGRPDATGAPLTPAQRAAIERAVRAIEALEAELSACEAQLGPYRPNPEPELRLRPPI